MKFLLQRLAFYVFTFRQPPCDHPPVPANLDELSQATDGALALAHGPQEVSCLRQRFRVGTDPSRVAEMPSIGHCDAGRSRQWNERIHHPHPDHLAKTASAIDPKARDARRPRGSGPQLAARTAAMNVRQDGRCPYRSVPAR